MVKYVTAIKDFSGGLSEVANDNIPENCLILAKNVVPGDGYGIARASGTSVAFEPIEGAAGPVVLLTELAIDSATHVIAATETGDGLKWNLWDWYYDEGEDDYSWHALEDGGGETDFDPILDWFIYADKLFWIDGQDYKYYNGIEVAAVAPVAPEGASMETTTQLWLRLRQSVAVAQHGGRWFFATPSNEIFISEVGKYDEFRETYILKILSGVNDVITALHEFNDGLLVFLTRSVYFISGWDFLTGSDIKVSRLSVESGTKWPRTIKTISNAVLYLGDDGVHRLSLPYFSSAIAATNISDKQASKRLSENIRDAVAEVFNGVYYISVFANGYKEYRYYLSSGSWWGEYTQEAHCYCAKLGGRDRLYLGCSNGYVLYYDPESNHYVNTVTGGVSSIPVEVKTKGYDVVGGTVIDAKVKRVFIVLKQYDVDSSSLTVQIKTDYTEGAFAAKIDSMRTVLTAVLREVKGDESLVWGEGRYSQAYWGWIDTVTKQFQLQRKCKRVQFIFRDDHSDEPLLIYGVALQYKKKKAKGSRLGVNEQVIEYDD